MSKVTFRADDDLVAAVEDLDASKSEVMREALRTYLAQHGEPAVGNGGGGGDAGSLDAVVADRVDELVEDALGDRRAGGDTHASAGRGRDVNVNITVESPAATSVEAERTAATESDPVAAGGDRHPDRQQNSPAADGSCNQCGSTLSGDHVYCPNCGEKATHRVFCECGDEVRADWSFCPHCGRRTASADALDRQG
ncbi:double zinc ribbon domain-containing protein [Halobacterium rubrum]|uniref:double zinc ribbon domain-containing protein n=1 Tax=Halobacterium TaxID=2239 RepID=UPI001F24AEF3|nr:MULTISPECIES: zinc ribbon domain-containing protein [Halobacterium]MDH5020182.1 zinc ribbon domain-containing protein [Halobacterium rubrum]